MDRTKEILRLHSKMDHLMQDDRFLQSDRTLITRDWIAAYFVATFRTTNQKDRWAEMLRLMTPQEDRRAMRFRWREVVRHDAPRYEPRQDGWSCCFTLTMGKRTGEPCGRSRALSGRITDPDTGEWRMQSWCRAHASFGTHALLVERTVRTTAPEPMPNVGGLLPCYIRASNWLDLYRSAAPGWEPPYCGIVADDWPVLTRTLGQPRGVELSVVEGDGTDGIPLGSLSVVP